MRDELVLFAFSLLYTTNIAISTISMGMVSLPFHQIVRSLGPVLTVAIEWALGAPLPSRTVLASLVPVVLGVALTSLGDIDFTAWGAFMTLLGVVLACSKGIATNRLLVGPRALSQLELLERMSVLSVPQCIATAWYLDELSGVKSWGQNAIHSTETSTLITLASDLSIPAPPLPLLHLLTNSLLALLTNLASFAASRHLGPLAVSVAANVKQVATVAVSVVLFGYRLNMWNGVGVVVTVLGGILYASASSTVKESQTKAEDVKGRANGSPSDDDVLNTAVSNGGGIRKRVVGQKNGST
ncbi:UAA transporter [Gonapodya sp. JEL0774]|nr:UAA transporter [Gonapodya sp. JEL0774]